MKVWCFILLVTELVTVFCATVTCTEESSAFGYELLITKIEELEVKLKEQSDLRQQLEHATNQVATLQTKLQEVQGQNANQANLQQQVRQLTQRLSQTQARLDSTIVPISQLMLHSIALINQNQAKSTHNNANLAVDPNVYSSCKEAPPTTGIYQIRAGPYILQGYCEQKDHGGGWLVIQRRATGLENFNRTWLEYRNGFGALDGDFWVGLEMVHQLTRDGTKHELLVEMTEKWNNGPKHVKWRSFQLDSEAQDYRITALKQCSGSGFCLGLTDGTPFNTFDKINTNWCQGNPQDGGWWYSTSCEEGNPNGVAGDSERDGTMKWFTTEIKTSRVMIRTT